MTERQKQQISDAHADVALANIRELLRVGFTYLEVAQMSMGEALALATEGAGLSMADAREMFNRLIVECEAHQRSLAKFNN